MMDLKSAANQLAHEQQSIVPGAVSSNTVSDRLAQYGCGPIEFSGTDNTCYERLGSSNPIAALSNQHFRTAPDPAVLSAA